MPKRYRQIGAQAMRSGLCGKDSQRGVREGILARAAHYDARDQSNDDTMSGIALIGTQRSRLPEGVSWHAPPASRAALEFCPPR